MFMTQVHVSDVCSTHSTNSEDRHAETHVPLILVRKLYHLRTVVWGVVAEHVRAGSSAQVSIDHIYEVYTLLRPLLVCRVQKSVLIVHISFYTNIGAFFGKQ